MTITVDALREVRARRTRAQNMIHRALARPPDMETTMFKPKIRGSLLDALERMAVAAERDPNEMLEELLSTATASEAPPELGQAKEPPPPAPKAAPPSTKAQDRAQASHPTGSNAPHDPSVPRLGETIATQKRRESGEDVDDQNAASDEETDNAPSEQMKGSRPSPLSHIKRWAGGEGAALGAPSLKSGNDEPADEDERKAALRRKHLAYAGRVQQRG